jgi:phosphoserine aminotransferase
VPAGAELVAVTHNETSTGMAWPWDELTAWRDAHPGPLLALDVTSSIASMAMDWTRADVWFGSVQKGFGLPAGLGLLLVGPRARERARELGARRRVAAWQDLHAMAAKIEEGQTVETPNVLAIALLARQMRRWDLAAIDVATREKARLVAQRAGDERFFVRDARWRSLTTHCLLVPSPDDCVRRAREAGFAVGRGYGALRPRSIRIGTFPSVSLRDLDAALHAVFTEGEVSAPPASPSRP